MSRRILVWKRGDDFEPELAFFAIDRLALARYGVFGESMIDDHVSIIDLTLRVVICERCIPAFVGSMLPFGDHLVVVGEISLHCLDREGRVQFEQDLGGIVTNFTVEPPRGITIDVDDGTTVMIELPI